MTLGGSSLKHFAMVLVLLIISKTEGRINFKCWRMETNWQYCQYMDLWQPLSSLLQMSSKQKPNVFALWSYLENLFRVKKDSKAMQLETKLHNITVGSSTFTEYYTFKLLLIFLKTWMLSSWRKTLLYTQSMACHKNLIMLLVCVTSRICKYFQILSLTFHLWHFGP